VCSILENAIKDETVTYPYQILPRYNFHKGQESYIQNPWLFDGGFIRKLRKHLEIALPAEDFATGSRKC
jgi:hypothetical protein